MIPKNTLLFASPDVDIAIIEAKNYCKDMGFTKEDIKIVRRGSQILVIAIKDLE